MPSPNSTSRIVVTGLGVVSPLGIGIEQFHDSLRCGQNGIRAIEVPWDTGYQVNRAGVVTEFGPLRFTSNQGPSGVGRCSEFAQLACEMAIDQAGLTASDRLRHCGMVVGTSMGEALELEKAVQLLGSDDPKGAHNGPIAMPHPFRQLIVNLKAELALQGPHYVVTTTCAAGNHAISMAAELLNAGLVDAALAVGVDTVGYVALLGFCRLLLQDPDTCRPFDMNRRGTIIAEGAGALLLERSDQAKQRGVEILAEVAGCGVSCDAAGTFAGDAADVRSLQIAAQGAFREAQCSPQEIDYVSAHGSATRLNDKKETYFLKQLLGDHAYEVPVSSIKSMLGHALGAAASLEAVACVLSLQTDVLYPTMNLDTPDPECDLDYIPNEARECRVNTILSNAFGMGGTNAIVIFRRWTDQ